MLLAAVLAAGCSPEAEAPSRAAAAAAPALAASTQGHGDAAFLFGYRVKPGMDADFAAGYRRHLDWHAERGDSLAWLGWSVVAGPGLGMFVDGVFGVGFRALDERVDPAGDARDAAENVTAFADAIYRRAYRLRRDLGSAARLESASPAAMQQVLRVRLRPEGVIAFERTLALVRGRGELRDFAAYELVSGDELPAFLLVVQLDAWADLEDAARDPARAVLREAGAAVAHAEGEIWLYRPDLTYIPDARDTADDSAPAAEVSFRAGTPGQDRPPARHPRQPRQLPGAEFAGALRPQPGPGAPAIPPNPYGGAPAPLPPGIRRA